MTEKLSKEELYEMVMPWGKYKGVKIKDINPDYAHFVITRTKVYPKLLNIALWYKSKEKDPLY